MASLGQNAYPQIREIAAGLPVNATYADLLAEGYQTELYTDSDETSGENDAMAYCCIELFGVRCFLLVMIMPTPIRRQPTSSSCLLQSHCPAEEKDGYGWYP